MRAALAVAMLMAWLVCVAPSNAASPTVQKGPVVGSTHLILQNGRLYQVDYSGRLISTQVVPAGSRLSNNALGNGQIWYSQDDGSLHPGTGYSQARAVYINQRQPIPPDSPVNPNYSGPYSSVVYPYATQGGGVIGAPGTLYAPPPTGYYPSTYPQDVGFPEPDVFPR